MKAIHLDAVQWQEIRSLQTSDASIKYPPLVVYLPMHSYKDIQSIVSSSESASNCVLCLESTLPVQNA